jgi:hypothetical protein
MPEDALAAPPARKEEGPRGENWLVASVERTIALQGQFNRHKKGREFWRLSETEPPCTNRCCDVERKRGS